MAFLVMASPAGSAAQWPPQSFTNLKVLPADVPVRELVDMMAGFTRALGVRCTYCHVGEESQPLGEYDFASDDKATKRKARQMLEMVSRINDVHLAGLESRTEPAVAVRCITCHRGTRQPRLLQDVLVRAHETGGIDSTLAAYAQLRDRYYGGFAYDFGEVPLADVAGTLAARGEIPDAIRLHELNIAMNPESTFAYASLAELLATAGDVAGAVRAYDQVGELLAATGDVDGAIAVYERSLRLDPDNANAIAKLRELRGRD